jgi:serine/threonine protein kinase
MATNGRPTHASEGDALLPLLQASLQPEFDVLRPLAEGSAARIYLARDRELDVLVVVKVLRRAVRDDETMRRRFRREARAAASLAHHPNVVAVSRLGSLEDGTPYVVMQYVHGRTLRERLQGRGRLEPEEGRRILADVAAALAHAHAQGLVHRDVRPGNVLLDEETGAALLTDFGIAAVLDETGLQSDRLTGSGPPIGDPGYLSPEQLRGEEVTAETDAYMLGVLGREIFTGQSHGGTARGVAALRDHLGRSKGIHLPDDVDADVADLLRRCLHDNPRDRPSLADAARILGRQGPGPAVRPSLDTDLSELARRRIPQIVLATFTAGLGLIYFTDALSDLLPAQSLPLVLAFVAHALVAASVVGWFHGARGRQRVPLVEYVLLVAVAVGWILSSWWILRG